MTRFSATIFIFICLHVYVLGAFLIPYLICVIIGGIPLFYLEVAVGQFMGVAGVKAWNLVPIFRGKTHTLKMIICVCVFFNIRYVIFRYITTRPTI